MPSKRSALASGDGARPPRRTQQERSSESERRLLDAAAFLIARKGANGITLAEVGSEAGYSRGIVYHQFGSKAALINRLVLTARQRLQERLQAKAVPGSGLDGILGLISAWVRPTSSGGMDDFARAHFVMWAEASAAPGEIRDEYIANDRLFRDMIRQGIARGIKDGSIRSDIDTRATAVSLLGHLHGIILQTMLDPEAPDIALDRVRRDVIQSWRRALSPEGASPRPAAKAR